LSDFGELEEVFAINGVVAEPEILRIVLVEVPIPEEEVEA
jgi:hypothetical protein